MPLPSPRDGESHEEFVNRCMREADEFDDPEQRRAVCERQWTGAADEGRHAMRYSRVLKLLTTAPWALLPEVLDVVVEILARRIAGRPLSDEEIEGRIAAGQLRAAARGGGARVGAVAVMPIIGVLLPRAEALERTSGAISTQELTARFDQLAGDPSVSAIVLDVDSPGGSVGGVEEFAERVQAAAARKPVIAIANPTMASAAYWIGSAAAELLVAPSAVVGSIGVYAAHEDLSAALDKEGIKVTLLSAGAKKVFGNPFEPLSDEGRAEIQKHVDAFYAMFVRRVAAGRGVAQKTVREGFGQGGVVGAQEAIDLKMADRIGTLDEAIALAAKRAGVKLAAEMSAPASFAETDDERAKYRLRLAEQGL